MSDGLHFRAFPDGTYINAIELAEVIEDAAGQYGLEDEWGTAARLIRRLTAAAPIPIPADTNPFPWFRLIGRAR